jgi:hypothetical protein
MVFTQNDFAIAEIRQVGENTPFFFTCTGPPNPGHKGHYGA